MKQNLSNKTVPELLQLKASWLKENEQVLRELALAVWEMGTHQEEYNREIAILQNSDFYFVASKASDTVDPKKGKPVVKYWLAVMKGMGKWYQGIQVAYYTFHENFEAYGSADKSFNNFVVPGDWLMVANCIIEAAHTAQESKAAEEEEKERQWLINKLLDGKDI